MEEEEKDVEKAADEDDVAAVRSTLIMRTWRILTLRFQIFFILFFLFLFSLLKDVNTYITIYYKNRKKELQLT